MSILEQDLLTKVVVVMEVVRGVMETFSTVTLEIWESIHTDVILNKISLKEN